DYEKAEDEFRAEAQLVPGSAAAAFKLGSVLLHRGQLIPAIKELRRASELRPDMPETLLELGKALNAAGDPASAAESLQRLLQLEVGTQLAATAHFQLAQSYRKLGRDADASHELMLFQNMRKLQK
ncbi:MAG: tetratricopeptide repeat protein, partial [Bryobacteraceae bacterium]